MSYKLFLDDIRDVPMVYKNFTNEDFVIVRNFGDFKNVISTRGLPEFISFDNDLGLDEHCNIAHMDIWPKIKSIQQILGVFVKIN